MYLPSLQLYRSALGIRDLAGHVDRAFLGDQRVMQAWLLKRVSTKIPSPGGKRGIVVPAGGVDQLANAFINIYVLRNHLKCTLPVTIAYWGAIEREAIDMDTITFFNSHLTDVTFLDLSKVAYPGHQRWLFPPISGSSYVGFKVKVFALYAAPYKEVLIFDSDNMPVQDPTPLFDLSSYRRHGNLFWPDRWCTPIKLYQKLSMDDGQGNRLQAESGQFLFDRERHFSVLEWLLFLNTHNEFTYRYAHGDKDTYRVAFELADKKDEYFQLEQPLSVALQPGLLGATARGFLQHHPNGSIAFLHRTSEAKYKAHSSTPRGFSRILLQPSCQWSQKYWHFFSPAVGNARSNVWRQSKCNFTLENPQASLKTCGSKLKKKNQPPVLEVVHNSYLYKAQVAADNALWVINMHIQTRPDLYPRRGGGGGFGGKFVNAVIVLTAIGVCGWGVLRGVAVWRKRYYKSWTLLPSSSSQQLQREESE